VAFLGGYAHYEPARIVTNAELAEQLACEADWIRSVSGIDARRYAAPEETVVDLAVASARSCLSAAGNPTIGMVIVASGTADRRFPGPAASVASALGLGHVPALDLPMPSAGGLFGLALASQLCAQYGDILVVASEKMSSVVGRPGTHPHVAMLFGDGAAACVVSSRTGSAQVLETALYSDGAFAETLQLGFTEPMQMDGRTVIMQAARKLPQAIRVVLARRSVPLAEVDAFLIHQANQNLTRQVARALDVQEDKFFSNISRYGNTSSASVLIALADWSRQARLGPGRFVVLAAFGAGLHWGAILLGGRE
jgi:3-oxoacyl-[acyl-carrier-protein] synthase-3